MLRYGRLRWLMVVLVVAAGTSPSLAQEKSREQQLADLERDIQTLNKKLDALKAGMTATPRVDGGIPHEWIKTRSWRCLGPANMGGRITAISIYEADPCTYWVATASGGLVKTVNNGITFTHQFDHEGGPVGTGKTFLAECYAGSIGIPCVVLRNFRSKYVGETEGNLEQVLTVLRSLGPVVVLIDEADAALGTRQAEGDSGTSSRVFSMIASQMGDTRYRGRIVWMLMTSRPDLLPIDLKRLGRAEIHIPLFYPQDEAEIREMFLVMANKNKVPLPPETLPAVTVEKHLSGSDIESIIIIAWRNALAAGRSKVDKKDLEEALMNFIPSAQGLEKELQELSAVLECTQLNFFPRPWREKVEKPDGRTRLQERLAAIRQLLQQ